MSSIRDAEGPPAAPSGPAPGLRNRVREGAEDRPGIYRFLGARREVLYVGKSVALRRRLLSYFRALPGSKPWELVRVAGGVEWEYVPNEFEALLRELRLIRAFRPRYNRRHRRERRFAWIRLTSEPAPRLLPCRRPRPDGSRHFGPFPADRRLPDLVRELARTVGLRDCPGGTPIRFSDQLELLGGSGTPACRRAETGTCPGPCASLCSEAEYRERVRTAADFLEGRGEEVLQGLRRRMETGAASREYEGAARLRDREERLRNLRRKVVSFSEFLKTLTFVYRVPPARPDSGDATARGYVLLNARVRLSFPLPERTGPGAELGNRIRRILAAPPRPPSELDADAREEQFLVAAWFRRHPRELSRGVPLQAFLKERRRGRPPGGGA